MSADLTTKIQLRLDELARIRNQISPLIGRPPDSSGDDIETAAACAMLHSFYTEIEKVLSLIAREWDGQIPFSGAWHRELLNQMALPTSSRPAVVTSTLIEDLGRVSRVSTSFSRRVYRKDAMGEALPFAGKG